MYIITFSQNLRPFLFIAGRAARGGPPSFAHRLREGPPGPRSPLRHRLLEDQEGAGLEAGSSFDEGLRKTVRWYLENRKWCENVRTGEYRTWLERNYARR